MSAREEFADRGEAMPAVRGADVGGEKVRVVRRRARRNADAMRPRRTATTCGKVISSRPSSPRVVPKPLAFTPPNGMRGIGGRDDEVVDEDEAAS